MGGGEESEKRKEARWRNGFQKTRVESDGWALKFTVYIYVLERKCSEGWGKGTDFGICRKPGTIKSVGFLIAKRQTYLTRPWFSFLILGFI
jgi:hypothetical protein